MMQARSQHFHSRAHELAAAAIGFTRLTHRFISAALRRRRASFTLKFDHKCGFLVVRMANAIACSVLVCLPPGENSVEKCPHAFIGISQRLKRRWITLRKNKKSKPMSGEMKVPSVIERRFDQFIEVHNLKAPNIL